MGFAFSISRVQKVALRLLVVLPLLALGLFPAGVMPGQGSDGQMVWVL